MGIRAVRSNDMGSTWDTDNTIILRDDGGTPSMLQGAPEAVDLEELRLSRKVFQKEEQRTVASANYPLQQARSDLGYAVSTQLSDETIVAVYYITLEDGVTHIAATRWNG